MKVLKISSFLLFVISLFYFFEIRNSNNNYFDSRKQFFNIDDFIIDDSVNHLDNEFIQNFPSYLILYAIPYNDCNVCVNEIFNIYKQTLKINPSIKHIIFVYDDDILKAKHALLTSDIVSLTPIKKLYGTDNFIRKHLEISGTERNRIALLINKNTNEIEKRLYLKSGLMSNIDFFNSFIPLNNN